MNMMARIEREAAPPPLRRELNIPPGNSCLRWITAQVIARIRRITPAEIAAEYWPHDKIVQQIFTRAATTPAMTGVAGWAAELAQLRVNDALAALGAASAGAQMLKSGLVLDMDGVGSISAPGFVAAAGNAGFVAEGLPIPVRQLASAAALLQPHKIGAIGVLTQEMADSSNAERLIGDVLARSAGLALDAALFDSTAASTTRPAGLRNGIAAQTASSATDLFEAFFEDVATLLNAVSAVGGNGPFAMIASPGRAAQMRMRFIGEDPAITVYGSTAAGNDLIAVATPALVAALSSEPDVETANAGELHMSDTPGPIVNGGAPAAPARSLWQTNSIAVKVRWPVTWALRDSRAVAWVTPTWK